MNPRTALLIILLAACITGPAAGVTEYTITATAGDHGAISPLVQKVTSGMNSEAFRITPDTNYDILDVLVDGVSVGVRTTYTFTRVDRNHTIGAVFTPKDGSLYIQSSPSGADIWVDGSKTSYQTNVNFPIAAGTHTITLKKTGYLDYTSDPITIDPGSANYLPLATLVAGPTPTATTTVPTTTTPVPTTSTPRYTITVTQGTHGTISPGTVTRDAGQNQAFTITPSSSYHISSVIADGVPAGAVTVYEFPNIQANHTLTAVFAQDVVIQYRITVTQASHGTISPGTVTKNAGESQTFSIAPSPGYHIGSVIVDGVPVGAVSTYPFTNIQANHTITAAYVSNAVQQYTISVTQGTHGTISPGTVVKNKGESQVFSITPDSDYQVSQVYFDGTSVGATESYTVSNIQANHTLTATYGWNPVTPTRTTVPTTSPTVTATTVPATTVTTLPATTPVTSTPAPTPTADVTGEPSGLPTPTAPVIPGATPGPDQVNTTPGDNGGGEPGVSVTDLLSVLPVALIPLAFLFSRDILKSGGARLSESRRTRALTAVCQAACGLALFTILNWFVRAGPVLSTKIVTPVIVFAMLLLTYGAFSAVAVSAGLILSRPLQGTLRVHIVIGVLIPLVIPILFFLLQVPDRTSLSLVLLAAPVSSALALWQEHALPGFPWHGPAGRNDGGVQGQPPGSVTTVISPTGQIIFPPELSEKYTDIRFLGMGGIARVFYARRTRDGAEVAVKIPITFDENTGKCFMKEIVAWEGLRHENIVAVTEVNILPLPYVEMEFVGSTLFDEERPIPLCRGAGILIGVAMGLAYAHERGIIHRDIKPQNILIAPDGTPKISDWGMSRVIGSSAISTVAGFSLTYAAPEQVSPSRYGETDQRTDIYQLGIVAYEIVTGKTPFAGEDLAEVSNAIVGKLPDPPSAVRPEAAGLDDIILTCLAKDPDARYQSVSLLLEDLIAFREEWCGYRSRDEP